MMMVKKENTIKQYWPQMVRMLCYGATINTAQIDAYNAAADASGQHFVDDLDTLEPALVHPALWDATKHLMYLRHADDLANCAAGEQHSTSLL